MHPELGCLLQDSDTRPACAPTLACLMPAQKVPRSLRHSIPRDRKHPVALSMGNPRPDAVASVALGCVSAEATQVPGLSDSREPPASCLGVSCLAGALGPMSCTTPQLPVPT